MHIRPEQEQDWAAVRQVNETAFETAAEAELVTAVRNQATPIISLVAQDGDPIIGHILFSPVTFSEHPDLIPRFGFAPAVGYGIRSEYSVPDDTFMVLELQPGYLRGISGVVKYHVAFG